MSEILGHDCDGKPLRAGDLVEIVPPADPQHVGVRCSIIGKRFAMPDFLIVDYEPEPGRVTVGRTHCFRKVQPKKELADWQTICLETGWYPGKPVRKREAA